MTQPEYGLFCPECETFNKVVSGENIESADKIDTICCQCFHQFSALGSDLFIRFPHIPEENNNDEEDE